MVCAQKLFVYVPCLASTEAMTDDDIHRTIDGQLGQYVTWMKIQGLYMELYKNNWIPINLFLIYMWVL